MSSLSRYHDRKAQGVCPRCQRPPAPGDFYCADCRTHKQAYDRAYTEANLSPEQRNARANRRTILAHIVEGGLRTTAAERSFWRFDLPGPALLCCGRWHTIETMPLTVPCCGTRYFVEELAHV